MIQEALSLTIVLEPNTNTQSNSVKKLWILSNVLESISILDGTANYGETVRIFYLLTKTCIDEVRYFDSEDKDVETTIENQYWTRHNHGTPIVNDKFEYGVLTSNSDGVFDIDGNVIWANYIDSSIDESW